MFWVKLIMSKSNEEDIKVTSKLAEFRKSKNLSQDELARLTGLTKTTIQNWENGRNLGAIVRLLKLCKQIDADPRDVFKMEE